MQLASFSVENYRSITKAYKVPLRAMTVIIGPNNEGKSNLVRALVSVLEMLTRLGRSGAIFRARIPSAGRIADYDWERDFPVNLQQTKPERGTVLNLEFQLTDDELRDFRAEVKSKLTGTLPIEITFLPDLSAQFKVVKKGPGGPALSKKSAAIARFIATRLDLEYIPAVRTAAAAQKVVDDLVSRALALEERDAAYREALESIAKIQAPVLARISETIRDSLAVFLPDVRNVTVQIPQETRSRALRTSCEIIVDDGSPTLLRHKGDGMQSLAALSLMRHASELGAGERQLVLAIEEPESHLHPRAIHQLRGVLQEISEKHQIIMTTHCPLFVDRVNVKSNIIVLGNKASSAKNINEIRDVLGVRIADNLRHADLVLLVEGEDDATALRSLLGAASAKLLNATKDGLLAIDTMLGGTNVAYKLGQLRDGLCTSHVLLDYDAAGRAGANKAMAEGLLSPADLTYTICPGMDDAELEDMYDANVYAKMLSTSYGVDIGISKFKAKSKWSMRMREVFKAHGKPWDTVAQDVKQKVAGIIALNAKNALNSHKREAFDALVLALEAKLDALAARA